jgi:hypothetical protein
MLLSLRKRGGGTSALETPAYLLSPSDPSIFADWKQTAMLGRLFHPLCRDAFRFGTVTLVPGISDAQIRATPRMIIEGSKA